MLCHICFQCLFKGSLCVSFVERKNNPLLPPGCVLNGRIICIDLMHRSGPCQRLKMTLSSCRRSSGGQAGSSFPLSHPHLPNSSVWPEVCAAWRRAKQLLAPWNLAPVLQKTSPHWNVIVAKVRRKRGKGMKRGKGYEITNLTCSETAWSRTVLRSRNCCWTVFSPVINPFISS